MSGAGSGVQQKAVQKDGEKESASGGSGASGSEGTSESVDSDPHAQDRTAMRAAAKAVEDASSLNAIASAIETAPLDAEARGEAAVKLRNAEKGLARAKKALSPPAFAPQLEAFVTKREPLALKDQKQIAATFKAGADKANPRAETNISDAQWNATKGPNEQIVLAPENLNASDQEKALEYAVKNHGIAKIFTATEFWKKLKPEVKALWNQYFPGGGLTAWLAQSQAARIPLLTPTLYEVEDKASQDLSFAPYKTASAAMDGIVTGSVGFAPDYKGFSNIADVETQLGLRPGFYNNDYNPFVFAGVVSTTELPKTIRDMQNYAMGEAMGKPTVFTSLLFSEFNYHEDERVINWTAVDDTTNPGKTAQQGKAEMAVVNMPASAFLSGKVLFIPK